MSMYTLLRNQPEPTIEEIENAFQGVNLQAQPWEWDGTWVSEHLNMVTVKNGQGIPGVALWKALAAKIR